MSDKMGQAAPAAPSAGEETRGLLYGFAGVCIFGMTLPLTRIAVAELDPLFLSLGRALVASVFAGAVLVLTRQPMPSRADLGRLAVVAAGIVFGFPPLTSLAMRLGTSGHGGVVLALLPLATAVASTVVAGERPSLGFWLCGLAGSLAVLAFAWLEGAFSVATVGIADLLLAAAIVAAAVGYALGGALSRRLGGWQVICWTLVISAPLVAICLLPMLPGVNWQASWRAWGSFLYLALGSQLIGFFFWNHGLSIGGVAKVGQVQLLQTFVTLVAAALLAGERIEWRQVVFAVLVVAIVALGRRTRVRRSG